MAYTDTYASTLSGDVLVNDVNVIVKINDQTVYSNELGIHSLSYVGAMNWIITITWK